MEEDFPKQPTQYMFVELAWL